MQMMSAAEERGTRGTLMMMMMMMMMMSMVTMLFMMIVNAPAGRKRRDRNWPISIATHSPSDRRRYHVFNIVLIFGRDIGDNGGDDNCVLNKGVIFFSIDDTQTQAKYTNKHTNEWTFHGALLDNGSQRQLSVFRRELFKAPTNSPLARVKLRFLFKSSLILDRPLKMG